MVPSMTEERQEGEAGLVSLLLQLDSPPPPPPPSRLLQNTNPGNFTKDVRRTQTLDSMVCRITASDFGMYLADEERGPTMQVRGPPIEGQIAWALELWWPGTS
ncbi:hypothetical protein N7462_005152 [Penicillium macrosclerotiorum]|uniref:uncharacterized protein n=1 Tax=Penicillium macrosclerotiorum TaxID=303699 RepID=UPI00254773C4|nr:uncharacterized protein N7462_005152 [Penicillium macrosclerotiorum]KAJ5690760.1 hypothetical protein N7462_005152 [Penicillium macrosclerotiorum]